jgi:hypothetical protein
MSHITTTDSLNKMPEVSILSFNMLSLQLTTASS